LKRYKKLPMHVQFFIPILDALRQLGGSATNVELKEKLIEILNIKDNELEEKLKNGRLRIDNQITWSKIYLFNAGLIDNSNSEILSLTEKGRHYKLDEDEVLKIFQKIHRNMLIKKDKNQSQDPDIINDLNETRQHSTELLEILRSLPPEGFERLCQRLLRASGFKKVLVKGRSGDGGIDGEGILEISPLVSMKVVFQCKRYKDAVSSSYIRDFRGAVIGRAEKGIFITTGRFTRDAREEAIRDGAIPIELVDGDKLIKLFEKCKLGLKEKIVYEIDESFFDEYR